MLFKQADVFIDGTFQRLDVRTEAGNIVEIAERLPGDGLDCRGRYLIPGLIDLHTHGCLGVDFSQSGGEAVAHASRFYAAHGVTSILPTTMTMPIAQIEKACRQLGVLIAEDRCACRLLGIHLEGPFFGAEKRGAHHAPWLMPPDIETYQNLQEVSGGNIKILDIDPALDGTMELIGRVKDTVRISIAHTNCGFETARQAVAAGAKHVTHLFNGMRGLHHRDPAVFGALYESDLMAELICDGIHIHPALIPMLFQLYPDKLILISDSIAACGLPNGKHMLGGFELEVQDGKITLPDGTIAGSAITVYDAMVHAIRFGVEPEQAILAATDRPAKALGLENQLGSIAVRHAADLVLTDRDFAIESVYVRGGEVKRREDNHI